MRGAPFYVCQSNPPPQMELHSSSICIFDVGLSEMLRFFSHRQKPSQGRLSCSGGAAVDTGVFTGLLGSHSGGRRQALGGRRHQAAELTRRHCRRRLSAEPRPWPWPRRRPARRAVADPPADTCLGCFVCITAGKTLIVLAANVRHIYRCPLFSGSAARRRPTDDGAAAPLRRR